MAVQPGLEGYDVARDEYLTAPRQGGRLVHLETDAVSESVVEALAERLLTPVVAVYCVVVAGLVFRRGLRRYESAGN